MSKEDMEVVNALITSSCSTLRTWFHKNCQHPATLRQACIVRDTSWYPWL